MYSKHCPGKPWGKRWNELYIPLWINDFFGWLSLTSQKKQSDLWCLFSLPPFQVISIFSDHLRWMAVCTHHFLGRSQPLACAEGWGLRAEDWNGHAPGMREPGANKRRDESLSVWFCFTNLHSLSESMLNGLRWDELLVHSLVLTWDGFDFQELVWFSIIDFGVRSFDKMLVASKYFEMTNGRTLTKMSRVQK